MNQLKKNGGIQKLNEPSSPSKKKTSASSSGQTKELTSLKDFDREQKTKAQGSHDQSIRFRLNNAKHVTENTRLHEVQQLFSTLEDQHLGQEFEDEDAELDKEIDDQFRHDMSDSDRGAMVDKNGKVKTTKSKLLEKSWRFLISTIFKINNLMLDNQGVTPYIYHIFLLFEFFQMLYYVFYKVELVNEFKSAYGIQTAKNNSTSQSAAANFTLTSKEDQVEQAGSQLIMLNRFRLDSYFMFANFQFYPLSQTRDRLKSFQGLYGSMNGLFAILLILIFASANNLFRASKIQSESKEWNKFLVRIVSIVIALFIFPFQIPMMTLNLQGYLCGEELLTELSLSEITCGSFTNQLFLVVSSAFLIVYLTFIIIQRQLYTSNSFESPLPWASFERGITFFKILQKLTISISIIFDKHGKYRAYENLIIFALGAFVSSQRFTNSIIFNRSVHVATTSYEMMLNWLFLSIPIYQLTATELSICTLFFIVGAGCVIIYLTIYLTDIRNHNIFIEQCEQPDRLAYMTQSCLQSELFCYRMCNLLVQSEALNNQHMEFMLQGLISMHLENCKNTDCQCQKVIGSWQMRRYHVKLNEENSYLNQLMIQELQAKKWSNQAMGTAINENSIYASPVTVPDQIVEQILPKQQTTNEELKKQPSLKKQQSAIIIRQDLLYGRKMKFAENLKVVQEQENEDEIINRTRMSKKKQQIGAKKRDSYNSLTFQDSVIQDSHHSYQVKETKKNVNPKLEGIEKMDTLSRMKKKFIYEDQSNIIREDTLVSLELEDDLENKLMSQGLSGETTAEVSEKNQYIKLFEHVDQSSIQEESLTMKYHYLSLFLDKAITLFPKSVELRLHNAYLQSQKLNNEFKAIFELMKAEQFNPSLRNRFYIFRRRILIERNLLNKNQKSIVQQEKINPLTIYTYEKLFLRYMKLEYLAATSSLNFWRELLQRTVNSNTLLKRGAEISKCYSQIQDVAKQLLDIFPSEIKFYYKYANFLKMIINNEQEAEKLFDRAASIYSVLSSSTKKATHYGGRSNEELIFGENTAVAVVMISLEAKQVGEIIHSNDEIYRILGYKRKQLIGKKINMIMPGPIASVHDRFLRTFLDTAKRSVIEEIRQVPALCADGYIRPVSICVKLYPQMSDKVVIIGFIQSLQKLDGFEPESLTGIIPSALNKVNHHYVISDTNNGISCLSEELAHEVGLNSKFFKSSDIFQQQKLGIDKVFGHLIISNQYQEDLMGRGIEMEINTRQCLQYVNIEQLTIEELGSVKSRIGVYPVHIQLKRIIYDSKLCQINLYRIILIPDLKNHDSFQQLESNSNSGRNFLIDDEGQQMSTDQVNSNSQFEMSSQISSSSTAADQANGTRRGMQDFKASIARRETPKTIIMLSRLLLILAIFIIILTTVEYYLKSTFLQRSSLMSNYLVTTQRREIKLIETAINLRSFVDVSNGMEYPTYQDDYLKRYTRFMNLRQAIKNNGEILQSAVDTLIQRQDFTKKIDDYEAKKIRFARLTEYQNVVFNEIEFLFALNNYLNNLLEFNVKHSELLTLNQWMILGINMDNKENRTAELGKLQRDLYFNLVNGFRDILRAVQEANIILHQSIDEEIKKQGMLQFQLILIIGIFLSLISLLVVVKELIMMQRTKNNILDIFSLLSNDEIKKVYDICDMFIDLFENGGQMVSYHQVEDEELQNLNESNPATQALATIQKKMTENLLGTTYQTTNVLQKLQISLQRRYLNKLNNKTSIINQPSEFISVSTVDFNDNDNSNSGVLNAAQRFYNLRLRQLDGQQISAEEYYGRILKQSLSVIRDEQQLSFTERHQFNKISAEINKNSSLRNSSPLHKSKQIVFGVRKLMETFEIGKTEKQKKSSGKAKDQMPEGKAKRGQPAHIKQKGKNKTIEEAKENEEESKFSTSSSSSNEDEPDSQRQLQLNQNIQRSKSEQNKVNDLYQQAEFINDKKQSSTKRIIGQYSNDEKNRKSSVTQLVIGKIIVTILFICYFIYGYVYHKIQLNVFDSIQTHSPIFFERYKSLYLSYAFLRERLITKNNYTTQELGFQIPSLPEAIYRQYKDLPAEDYYHQRSLQIEGMINQHKVNRPKGLDPIIDLFQKHDSTEFCSSIFEPRVLEPLKELTDQEKIDFAEIRKKAYKKEIDTVISACTAASEDDIEGLRSLKSIGVDLNIGDYDNRTPIHVAVATGRLNTVRYLIEEAKVVVSPVDRWFSTPLNDAEQFPSIYKYMISKGAVIGKKWPYVVVQGTASLDQYRIVYAATNGDLKTLDALRRLGVDLNGMDYDGRTALHLAGSEGKLNIIKYLSNHVQDLLVKDARLNDPLDDAQRGNFTDSENFLVGALISLRNDSCIKYANGLFEKGVQQAIGSFQRKYADLQIAMSAAQTSKQYQDLLYGNQTNNTGQSTLETMKIFFSVQELFLYKAVDKLLSALQESFSNFNSSYEEVLKIIFFLFLAIQIITMTILRRKLIQMMREEIMKSRGILNLVPLSFFMDNREASDRVMKIMKN